MAEWIDNKIKGDIAETIVENLFEKLGFYVFRIGQESTINPITHLERFIKSCGGEFKLENTAFMDFGEIKYLKKLPDFVIIDKNGRVDFLEVKFRKNGVVNKEALECLSLYPCKLLVINIELDANKLIYDSDTSLDNFDELKGSRFHIWLKSFETIMQEETDESLNSDWSVEGATIPLKDWLKQEFDIEEKELLEKYEKLVKKWFSKEEDEP